MGDRKDDVFSFFGCLYVYMSEFPEGYNNAKNQQCFLKHYEDMAYTFEESEDAGRINWQRMTGSLMGLQSLPEKPEYKRMEISQEVFEEHKDIDMFFGILYQCMMLVTDSKGNRSDQILIKNVLYKAKERLKEPKYVGMISWERMWQVFMNSEVYSMAIKKNRKDRGDSSLERYFYLVKESDLRTLMYEDTKKKSYSHFVCVLKADYIGFDMEIASGTDAMKGIKKKFEDIIRALDREGQIENVFTHYKGEGKRPIWEVSAVDAEAFYIEIYAEDPEKPGKPKKPERLYSRFCSEKGWEASYESVKELIKCFAEKGDRNDWYKEYKRLDRVAEILCQLVPMVSYEENGDRYIKTYSRWKEDCERITEIVHEKALAFGMDQIEIKAAELVKNYIYQISENGYEKRIQNCFKERYLDFLAEQSEKFLQSLDKVYWGLEIVEDEKEKAEIAKKAVECLYIK